MQRNFITLSNLPLNSTGYINNLECSNNIKRRLLDLGLVKNSTITPVLISPSGEPKAFEIKGTLIAIRKEDTDLIYVSF